MKNTKTLTMDRGSRRPGGVMYSSPKYHKYRVTEASNMLPLQNLDEE